jgi:hypothetical protein
MFVVLVLVSVASAAVAPELFEVHNVYILPMANGVDQYLANKLTRAGLFRVVIDPKMADAVFTDHTGPGFEEKLNELYPPPKVEKPEKTEKAEAKPAPDKDKEKDKDKKDTASNKDPFMPAFPEIKNADEPKDIFRPKTSPWTRGKGNVFLVSRQSHTIIWSYFDHPKDNRPATLDHMAEMVVKKLTGDVKRPNE